MDVTCPSYLSNSQRFNIETPCADRKNTAESDLALMDQMGMAFNNQVNKIKLSDEWPENFQDSIEGLGLAKGTLWVTGGGLTRHVRDFSSSYNVNAADRVSLGDEGVGLDDAEKCYWKGQVDVGIMNEILRIDEINNDLSERLKDEGCKVVGLENQIDCLREEVRVLKSCNQRKSSDKRGSGNSFSFKEPRLPSKASPLKADDAELKRQLKLPEFANKLQKLKKSMRIDTGDDKIHSTDVKLIMGSGNGGGSKDF
jgi:hypothetical protein